MSERPTDCFGQPVRLGPWYWAQNKTGRTIGTGRFLAGIHSGDILFHINDVGYGVETFKAFQPAAAPTFEIPAAPAPPSDVATVAGELPEGIKIRGQVPRLVQAVRNKWSIVDTADTGYVFTHPGYWQNGFTDAYLYATREAAIEACIAEADLPPGWRIHQWHSQATPGWMASHVDDDDAKGQYIHATARSAYDACWAAERERGAFKAAADIEAETPISTPPRAAGLPDVRFNENYVAIHVGGSKPCWVFVNRKSGGSHGADTVPDDWQRAGEAGEAETQGNFEPPAESKDAPPAPSAEHTRWSKQVWDMTQLYRAEKAKLDAAERALAEAVARHAEESVQTVIEASRKHEAQAAKIKRLEAALRKRVAEWRERAKTMLGYYEPLDSVGMEVRKYVAKYVNEFADQIAALLQPENQA